MNEKLQLESNMGRKSLSVLHYSNSKLANGIGEKKTKDKKKKKNQAITINDLML